MDNMTLQIYLKNLFPDSQFPDNKQYTELLVPEEKWHPTCDLLKNNPELQFDFLISLTAVDWQDHFMMVCHITSTVFRHTLVLKTRINDRTKPEVDTISDVWKSAEFHEREVFDLFGIAFRNHPDLRRLFLEDDYGYPLRKDFMDESRMIVR